MTDWTALAERAALVSHDLVGWTYWDRRGIRNYRALGVPDGVGYYVAVRFGPLAAAGADAVAAAGYSINPVFIAAALELCQKHTDLNAAMRSRDKAVTPGLSDIDPALPRELAELAEPLWAAVDSLPASGRVLFAAHRARPRPTGPNDGALSAWLAVNCLREWRGDTHWALCVAADLDWVEVGLLHDVMVEGYDPEWIARSRGADDASVARGWARLEARGLAANGAVTDLGEGLRLDMEHRTNELSGMMWQAVGELVTLRLCHIVEPLHDRFLARIDDTAGPNWMPAARQRR